MIRALYRRPHGSCWRGERLRIRVHEWYVYTPLFVYVTDRKTVDKCQQVVSIFLVITGDYTPNFNGNDYTYFFIHKVEIEAIYQKMTSRRRSVKK